MDFTLLSLPGICCCLAFFFAGVIDSISGGGGLITVPVMIMSGIPTHFITGTNQCSAWLGTFAATYKYMKSKKLHYFSALVTVPFAIFGSFIGARLNLLVPDKYLQTFMIVMIPIIAIIMFLNKELGEEDKIDTLSNKRIVFFSILIGFFLGGYQGFYGPGAGMFFMLAYAASLKLNLVRATANTRFVLALSSTTAVITYGLSGNVIWGLVVAANIFNILGSLLGAELAIRNGSKIIRPITFTVVALLLIKLLFL